MADGSLIGQTTSFSGSHWATRKLTAFKVERGTGQASAADGAIIAPMPGKVIAVDVSEGQAVTAGQRLLVLEAMKMEHALTAPFDGVVEGLSGQRRRAGAG